MKKILIISEYFAPNNEIASVRITKLAKYLKLYGYYIGVVSRKMRFYESVDSVLLKELIYVDEHIVVSESKLFQSISRIFSKQQIINKQTSNHNTSRKSIIKFIFVIIYKIMGLLNIYLKKYFDISYYQTKSYSQKAKKTIKYLCRQYDVIITSSGPLSSNVLGLFAKKINPNILWIADYRDPIINCFPLRKNLFYYNKTIKEISKNADVITGVTNSCVEVFKDDFEGDLITICNGFDKNDINNLEEVQSQYFSLTYAGTLYKGKSDLSIVFEILCELVKESRISKKNIIVNYLGNDGTVFLDQARKYDFEDRCITFGKVNRKKSLEIQMSSHILLLASWNYIGYEGVITGKFLEYMMINKPIICTVTGNLMNSTIKEMINNANNGVVWEQANDKIDYLIMKEYIFMQYSRYIEGKPLIFLPNQEYISQFSYDKIIDKFINIINQNLQ